MCCIFHEEKTPSLSISEAKNVYHCLGCGAGGSVIDWVMKQRGVTFRHAVELLREGLPGGGGNGGSGGVAGAASSPAATAGPVKRSSVRVLAAPVTRDADDESLMRQVVGYYRDTLKQSPEALAYLNKRGLTHPELIDTFQLGYANRTLGLRLPYRNRAAGAELRGRLERLGI